jgi:hypothetical protein
MRKPKSFAAILCVLMLVTMMPATALPTDTIIEAGTAAELRAALENDAGAHVRLTNDIPFTTASAADRDVGVYLGEGCYTIDLNGFTLEYNYRTGGEFSEKGVPVNSGRAKLLVINGPGTLIGGEHGLEQIDQFGTLVVNGGMFKGVMGYGIRITGGVAYINGGKITGNFGGFWHEDGILVLNGGEIQSVQQKQFHPPQKRGLVRNGVFTGNTVLEDIVLSVDNLTIAKDSSIRVIRGGGLIIKNSFVNNGTFVREGGLQSIGGEATIKPDAQGNYTPVKIFFDTSFNSLAILERAALRIENGATVTVTGAFSTGSNSHVDAENGKLRLLGSIDHRGRADGVPELDVGGGGMPPRDFTRATEAAERLNSLGLFQGVGTNPDGSTNYDLARAPSRAEALVMLIRLLDKEEEALSGRWTHPFTDVPKWADKYVGYAYANKISNGVSADRFGTDTASCQMYLTFVLRSLGYSDSGGTDFTWDKPEELARSVGIMPEGIHVDNFLRADMVLISEAALSAKLKNSSDTLLDKLKAQDDEVEMSNSIPAWNKVYTPGMSVQTADELDALILAAVRNLVPQFEIMLDNAAYDAYFIEQEDPLINLNVGTTHTEYMYETREFVFKAEYSLYHQLQGIIFNRSAVEQYVSAEVRDFDRQMRAILDKIITPNMTDRQKIKAVHDYMVTTYKYDVNFESGLYGNETYTFYGLLKNKTGVCQAYAELFYLFMCYEGIECYFVSGWADDGTGVYGSHLWNVVYVDDGYYHIDVTFDDPVPDGGEISYKYFLKTSEEITKDHTW